MKGDELFGAIKARQIGPAVMSGRVVDLEAHPKDSKVYYVAAAGGGVWKTVNAGVTFNPIFDKHTQCIGSVAVDPSEHDADAVPTSPASAELSIDISSRSALTLAEARIEEATRKAKQHSGGLKIFSGNGNMSLALEVTRHLGVNLGKATVGKFADGEVNVVIHENVRGKDVYVIQPTGPPVNDNIMELLLMVSTLRRSSARRITVVIPYYGYARQDRKMQVRAMRQTDGPVWLFVLLLCGMN